MCDAHIRNILSLFLCFKKQLSKRNEVQNSFLSFKSLYIRTKYRYVIVSIHSCVNTTLFVNKTL